jgi:MoaA/NifB/PqqE/SkfB family radical SAM enzyme
MFTRSRPYIFHIELTDKCNAGCPMCPRTDAMNFCKPDRKNVFNVELSLDDFKQHFTDDFCARTEEIVFGGAYGDPLAASQLIEIADYLTARGVRLAVSTNGSLRNTEWWRRLGEMMKRTGSRLELHIDPISPPARGPNGTTSSSATTSTRSTRPSGCRARWASPSSP